MNNNVIGFVVLNNEWPMLTGTYSGLPVFVPCQWGIWCQVNILRSKTHTSPTDTVCLLSIRWTARRSGNAASGSMKEVRSSRTMPSSWTVSPWCSQNSVASVSSSKASCFTSSETGYYGEKKNFIL